MVEEGKAAESFEPLYLYSYEFLGENLWQTNLATGEVNGFIVPGYVYRSSSSLTELPEGKLVVTGGSDSTAVDCIDTISFEVTPMPPMHQARASHTSIYHAHYLYVVGGIEKVRALESTERFNCRENRWELLPNLPEAAACCSLAVMESTQSIYAFGGSFWSDEFLNTIKRLSLVSLTWEIMQTRLPYAGEGFPVFKRSASADEIYYIHRTELYVFLPLREGEVVHVRSIDQYVSASGQSFYRRGVLYTSSIPGKGGALELAL